MSATAWPPIICEPFARLASTFKPVTLLKLRCCLLLLSCLRDTLPTTCLSLETRMQAEESVGKSTDAWIFVCPGGDVLILHLALLLQSLRTCMLESRLRWLSLIISTTPYQCPGKPVINLSSTAFFVVYSAHSSSITPARGTLSDAPHLATSPDIDLPTSPVIDQLSLFLSPPPYERLCEAT